MTLGELIDVLKRYPPHLVVKHGFVRPHSYRGYYDELAFEPEEYVTVEQMLKAAQSAVGRTYSGWKGGLYTMDGDTDVWLAEEGTTGEALTQWGLLAHLEVAMMRAEGTLS